MTAKRPRRRVRRRRREKQQEIRPAGAFRFHVVESGAGAPALGSGGMSVAFAPGPQSGSPGRVSSPPLIKPDVRISRIRLSDGIMPPHVAQSGVSEHCVALIGSRQWPCPAPFLCRSRSQAPFLGRRYPASSVVRACPPPCRPGLVLADFRLASTRHRQGFPCCCAFHLPCMPTPLPRRKRTGASAACFPDRHRSSPNLRRVDSRIALFEACSAFTRVPACMVAEPPEAAASAPECFSLHRYLRKPLWLLPAEATIAEWVSHPQGKRAFPRRT